MIVPAILETSLQAIKREIEVVDTIAEKIQVDVCDGILVDSITYLELKNIVELQTKTDIEIHLMVKFPYSFLKNTDLSGASKKFTSICSQIEAQELDLFINYSKELGLKVGLSIAPGTSIFELTPYLEKIDFVQFMAVHPGKQGQHLSHQVLEKIKLFKKEFPRVTTQIDGGVTKENLTDVLKTGVDNVVIGSAIFNTAYAKQN